MFSILITFSLKKTKISITSDLSNYNDFNLKIVNICLFVVYSSIKVKNALFLDYIESFDTSLIF